MEQQAATQVIERISREMKQLPNGVLAFDGDGTLWSGDVGEDSFFAWTERGEIHEPAIEAMKKVGGEFRVTLEGDGPAIAKVFYQAYVDGTIPEERTCEMMAWITAGFTQHEIEAWCQELVGRVGLKQRLHKEAMEIVSWAQSKRIDVFLVSASPRFVVQAAARTVGIKVENVVAATPIIEKGMIRAEVMRPIPYGDGKVERLRERIGANPLLAAFGDNVFDVPLLNEACVAIAVRPKDRLRAKADSVPGLVELARRTTSAPM